MHDFAITHAEQRELNPDDVVHKMYDVRPEASHGLSCIPPRFKIPWPIRTQVVPLNGSPLRNRTWTAVGKYQVCFDSLGIEIICDDFGDTKRAASGRVVA